MNPLIGLPLRVSAGDHSDTTIMSFLSETIRFIDAEYNAVRCARTPDISRLRQLQRVQSELARQLFRDAHRAGQPRRLT